jgi:hypothetical protein
MSKRPNAFGGKASTGDVLTHASRPAAMPEQQTSAP